jgi:SAM-dependent methyltransferase
MDLGCGDGLLTRILLEEVGARQIVGVDPDPAEASRAEKLGIYSIVHTVGGNSVPEPDGSFDWVLSNSVLEHIEELDPILGEVGRLLRSNGQFVFTVPGPDFHACLRGPLTPGASRETYVRHLDARLAHHRYWGVDEWESALRGHGMRVAESSVYLTEAEVRRWESISRVTAGILYALARRRPQPIEIQRRLGMRKAGQRMPLAIARRLATVLSSGLKDASKGTSLRFGCLLVTAAKR